jgi:hypothetical protein
MELELEGKEGLIAIFKAIITFIKDLINYSAKSKDGYRCYIVKNQKIG